jgi:hypothetical protein
MATNRTEAYSNAQAVGSSKLRYTVRDAHQLGGEWVVRRGDIVEEVTDLFGLAVADTRRTGVLHLLVRAIGVDGTAPFTIPFSKLKRVSCP